VLDDVTALAELPRALARAHGAKAALLFQGETVSYAELEERVYRATAALRPAGVQAGDRVAFLDKNGLEYFELLFGAARLGAVLAPLNWRLAPAEMAYIIDDAQAVLLVAHQEFASQVAAIEASAKSLREVILIGDDGQHRAYAGWLASVDDVDSGDGSNSSDAVGLQVYTSGTTGHPKGVMLSNGNLLALLRALPLIMGLRPNCVQLTAMPLYHIGGTAGALGALFQGGTVVLLREAEIAAILRAIDEQRVSHIFAVPAVIQFMLQHPDCATADFSSVEVVAYGASPIPEGVLKRALARFGCGFLQSYGLTETTGPLTLLSAEDHTARSAPHRLRSAGRAIPGSTLRIVDAESGADRAVGEVGEVWMRSPQNMLGYWRNPEATAETLRPDNWLRSGDAGYLDADGYLYLYDRVKDLIISGAENVYPAEVESALSTHPAVADVAVIGVPDDTWGEAVKAIVVREPGATVGAAELIAYARERLAGFKTPKSVEFVASLPRNPSGKLLKRELREPYWQGRERRIH
jgi:long-chain acyl-CoA synthetase